MKPIDVVVPDKRDSGEDDCRERKVGECQTKQPVEVTVAVGIGRPDEDKNLKNVENDGDEPGADSPAGHHAVDGRMKLAALFIVILTVQFDRVRLN